MFCEPCIVWNEYVRNENQKHLMDWVAKSPALPLAAWSLHMV